MPLQIRRGTQAERVAMTQPLAQGELLYVTDDQRLYIGNGSTLGGIQITGYTNNDAQDAAAAIFTGGTHTGIGFTYNSSTNLISANVDLSNYQGTIKASSINGSIVANDSTLMIDGELGRIVGPVFSNVTGNLTGNVTGNVTGNLTGNVTGNLNGNVTGDVRGSIFAADSSVIVDQTDGSISTSSISHPGGELNLGNPDNPTTVAVTGLTEYPFAVRSITDGTTPPNIGFLVSKGTLAAPTTLAAGDEAAGMVIRVYDGTTYKSTFGMLNQLSATANMADANPESDLIFATSAGGSNFSAYLFKGNGTLELPGAAQVGVFTSAPETRPTGVKGMIIFNDSTSKFQGFDGTTWVDLN